MNGAVELAPKLGICSRIVDLVSTGKTLKENNLKEYEILMQITSKLIINKIAFKLMNDDITKILKKLKRLSVAKILFESEDGFKKSLKNFSQREIPLIQLLIKQLKTSFIK